MYNGIEKTGDQCDAWGTLTDIGLPFFLCDIVISVLSLCYVVIQKIFKFKQYEYVKMPLITLIILIISVFTIMLLISLTELAGPCSNHIIAHLLDGKNWWSYILGHWIALCLVFLTLMVRMIMQKTKKRKEHHLLDQSITEEKIIIV